MNRELRRVSILVVLMFVALFASSSIIQVFQQGNLKSDGRNARVLYASFDSQRGPILVDGQPIAYSERVDSRYNYQRVYPSGQLYSTVTGFFTVLPSTGGLEHELNSYLTGDSDAQFLARLNAILTGQDPQGSAVELTIDPVVQQAAWDALGDERGAIVALDPKTGAILALVSKPTSDPTGLAVLDPDAVEATYEALDADANDPLIDRAIEGDLNPPGSVFKLVVTAAALESGQYSPESEFPNPPTLDLPGTSTPISNSADGTCGGAATATIATALRLSCNTTFAQLAGALGQDALREQAQEFGFGQELGIPMRVEPSVYPQIEPNDEAQVWLTGFGQASVRTSPLQMAMVSAAIANRGVLMQPTIVESIVAPDLSVLQEFQPQTYSTPISPETSATMTQMMVQGVANGVANNARIDGVGVAGKTGTAENGPGEPYTLWFTGFAPANDPQVAIAVVIEDRSTGFGNLIAAPIAKQVMEAVLNR
jgi:peptidoglycan glycosyltransferase